MVLTCNELKLDGNYDMDGKFLLLPLKGKGKTQMQLSKFDLLFMLFEYSVM